MFWAFWESLQSASGYSFWPADPHPSIRAAIIAGLLISTSIATYTVWDKYVVSVIHVSQILLDLLANPLQALLLTPLLITALPTMKNHFVNSNQTLAFPTNQRKVKPPPTRFRSMFQDA